MSPSSHTNKSYYLFTTPANYHPNNMPTKRFIDPKKASSYKVVHKSVEDPTYEDEGTAVTLKHIDKSQNRRAKGFENDIIREEMYTYDMQNPDDTVEKGIFEGEVEADFDQDFIREMMLQGMLWIVI